jgi:chorismate synthase
MNSFGRIFRVSIFGESHGPAVGVVVDGCPAGIPLDPGDLQADLVRRQGGASGTTSRVEDDTPHLVSGVFEGRTTGAPILIVLDNTRQDSGAYEELRYTPRPGHADFTAFSKYGGFNDHRGGGHFSGRLTAALVAAGGIAKKIIAPVTVKAALVEAGGSRDLERTVSEAAAEGDSIGGIIECTAEDIPIGLGEPFFDPLESLISHGVFSIPAVKGIEFGAGFSAARMRGSTCNDEIVDRTGATRTNNAGGIAGGISNGNELVFRVAVKPTPSIRKIQETVDVRDGQRVSISVEGRHDTCIALRMPVIVEAVTAIVLADCMLAEQMVPSVWTARPSHPAAGERGEEEAGAPAARSLDGLLYDAIAEIPGGVIFDEDTVAKLETITSRLEHLKHIIRGRDEEELRLFFSRARGSR